MLVCLNFKAIVTILFPLIHTGLNILIVSDVISTIKQAKPKPTMNKQKH